MNAKETALILIGYQNDYFADNGMLHSIIAENIDANNTLGNTLDLIGSCLESGVTVYNIPILFSDNYEELENPIGLLATIKDVGAFKASGHGGHVIDEFEKFGDELIEVKGKTGFNAFNKTDLYNILTERGIKNIAFAGAVTSVCIDSSARASFEFGFNTIVLSDCIGGRSDVENSFYCGDIFPLYAKVLSSKELLAEMTN